MVLETADRNYQKLISKIPPCIVGIIYSIHISIPTTLLNGSFHRVTILSPKLGRGVLKVKENGY